MQFQRKSRAWPVQLCTSRRILCIIAFVFVYVFGLVGGVPQVFAAAPVSAPGGHVADPVVRQVDIARPAVVRIITKLGGHLTVQFAPTTQSATFPQGGGSYPIELSGSGSFISAHGDILTADHVVNPPHDQSINDALYQIAAPDIADYINTHLHPNQPFSSGDVVAELEAGVFPSTPVYDQPTSEVYLSTAYASSIDATRFSNIPANLHASVDRIEAQSSFEAMDVAIVHVPGMDDMPSIQLDDSEQVAEQDNLTVIGFPGLADESRSPTNLLTSSINKLYVSAIKTTDANAPVIQVGGNIEHGDSGGPVLDSNGHIVGIVSFGLFDPNETGSTSFLQASNSARTLIQSLNLDTTPGPFQKEWMQAFNDYSSPTPGHWHKASQEFQNLVNGHPGFLGVTSYLVYAQNQASTEQLPTSATGPNPVLIIVLALLGVLVVFGIIYFVVIARRTQAVPAVPASGWGAYAQPQSGMPGGYVPSGYSSGSYQPVAGATPASVPDATSGTYPPVPTSSSGAAWYAQTTSAIPQTPQPQPGATPTPVAAAIPTNGATPPALPPFSAQDDVAPQAARPPMPTWAPLPQTPQPVVQPIEPLVQGVAPLVEIPAQPLAQDETVVILPPDTSALETPQPTDVSAQETQQVMDVSSLETPQPELAVSFAAEISQDGEQTVLAQPVASSRNFFVPRRPVAFSQEMPVVSSQSGVHTWLAPCGHTNTPEVRFCRVCGQPVRAEGLETNE